MLIEFQKTETGVTLHLPEDLADASVFDAGNLVDVSRENGHLIVRHPNEPHYDIEKMIASITDENRHEEIGTSAPADSPRRRSKYTTAELLKGVTDENIHGETDWGPPVGREVW